MKHSKSFTIWTALIYFPVLAVCLVTPRLPGQEKKPYQAGTIVDVKPHQAAQPGDDTAQAKKDETPQYDISVKVGNKVYVVLYTPPPGQNYPELGIGMDRTVLVDGDTMKVNDLLGRTRTMPILSTRDTPPKTPN
jgi:hypothetical protein